MSATRSIPLAQFRDQLVSLYRATGKRPKTVKRMSQVLTELLEVLGPAAETADLTTAAIVDWMAAFGQRRVANTTIGLMSYIRAATSYAVEEGLLERAPNWRRLWPRRSRPKGVRHHPWAQIARLLESLRARATDWKSQRLYALTAVVAYTGIRRDEALMLRLSDLDLPGGVIQLVPHPRREFKTEQSAQPVPIPPELRGILLEWLPNVEGQWLFPGVRGTSPWQGGAPGYRPIDHLRQAGLAVGVDGLSWQSLRRSWATHAESRWGLTDPQIQRVLRHTSPLTSQIHYRQADLDNLAAIAARVSFHS